MNPLWIHPAGIWRVNRKLCNRRKVLWYKGFPSSSPSPVLQSARKCKGREKGDLHCRCKGFAFRRAFSGAHVHKHRSLARFSVIRLQEERNNPARGNASVILVLSLEVGGHSSRALALLAANLLPRRGPDCCGRALRNVFTPHGLWRLFRLCEKKHEL